MERHVEKMHQVGKQGWSDASASTAVLSGKFGHLGHDRSEEDAMRARALAVGRTPAEDARPFHVRLLSALNCCCQLAQSRKLQTGGEQEEAKRVMLDEDMPQRFDPSDSRGGVVRPDEQVIGVVNRKPTTLLALDSPAMGHQASTPWAGHQLAAYPAMSPDVNNSASDSQRFFFDSSSRGSVPRRLTSGRLARLAAPIGHPSRRRRRARKAMTPENAGQLSFRVGSLLHRSSAPAASYREQQSYRERWFHYPSAHRGDPYLSQRSPKASPKSQRSQRSYRDPLPSMRSEGLLSQRLAMSTAERYACGDDMWNSPPRDGWVPKSGTSGAHLIWGSPPGTWRPGAVHIKKEQPYLLDGTKSKTFAPTQTFKPTVAFGGPSPTKLDSPTKPTSTKKPTNTTKPTAKHVAKLKPVGVAAAGWKPFKWMPGGDYVDEVKRLPDMEA